MKDTKVRLNEKEYKKLRKIAEREIRSINRQITFYIRAGLEEDEKK